MKDIVECCDKTTRAREGIQTMQKEIDAYFDTYDNKIIK